MATPLIIHHIDKIGSTQDEANRLAELGGVLPLLLIARSQSRGRGRQGRGWLTAPCALACSLVVRPEWSCQNWSRVPLVAGLAARSAIKEVVGLDVSLKWPNDLVTGDGKIGGVLSESSGDRMTVGLGVNLWWPDPPSEIAALGIEDPEWEIANSIALIWAERMISVLDGDFTHWGYEEYRKVCVTLGTEIIWEPDGRGVAVDIAFDGALLVDTTGGRLELRSGEVREVRPTTLDSDPGRYRGDDAR